MPRFYSHHRDRAEAERREAFARMVGCELRDPLMIADATLKQAQNDLDPEQFTTITEAHARMSQRLDDLSAFARRGITVRDMRSVDLGTVARRRWGELQTGDAMLTVESTYQLQAEPQLFGLLLDRLFRSLLDYALLPSRSNAGRTDRTETARSNTQHIPEPRPIVVSPGEMRDGHGFYVGVDGSGSSSATASIPVSGESVARSEIIAAIDVARDIVSGLGWLMEMIRDDNSVRIEITTTRSDPGDCTTPGG